MQVRYVTTNDFHPTENDESRLATVKDIQKMFSQMEYEPQTVSIKSSLLKPWMVITHKTGEKSAISLIFEEV